jgi:hypothetical protein
VFEGLGGLRDELRRFRAGGDQSLPMADYEISLGISPG